MEKNDIPNVFWTSNFSLLVAEYVRKFLFEGINYCFIVKSLFALKLGKNKTVALKINKYRDWRW